VPAVRLAVDTAFLSVATGVAAASWWPIYQDTRMIVVVVVAVLVGATIAVLGAIRRWSAAIVAAVTVAAFVAVGVPLAVPDAAVFGVLPSIDGLRQLVAGTALSWKQLLTISLPVGSYQALLVPLLICVLLSMVVALTAALRLPRAWGNLGPLATAVVFVVGIAFGPDSPTFPRASAILFVVVIVVWLIVRRREARGPATADGSAQPALDEREGTAARRGRRRIHVRSVLSGLLILAVASVAAVALAGAVPPAGARQVLRSSVDLPFDPREYPSPLVGFRAYLDPDAADDVLFTITDLPTGQRVRIATLDTYDGVAYSVGSGAVDSASGYFSRVPYRIEAPEGARDVRVGVTIEGYDGVWVPTLGSLRAVDFRGARALELDDGFFYNATTGTAAELGGLARGDVYDLDASVLPEPALTTLAGLTPGEAHVPGALVVPEELDAALSVLTAGAETSGERLLAMINGLRDAGYVSSGADGQEPSRSGHSADRIAELLTGERMIGDAEQYAVAAALMAGELGYPARVVFGFAPDDAGTGPIEVRGSSVSAWIEVDTAERGWVTVDPTPDPDKPIPEAEDEEDDVISRPPTVVQPPLDPPPPAEHQSAPESSEDRATAIDPRIAALLLIARIAAAVLLALAVLIAPFLGVVAAKARRRHRRRHAHSPLERISGGWREVQDAAIDHRISVPAAATRREFATSVGSPGLVVLASAADRAVFAPDPVTDADADRVWHSVDELRAALDRGATRRERLRAAITTRSLGGLRTARAIVRRGRGA
jgi:transglutaminase-like putative cysteine protease